MHSALRGSHQKCFIRKGLLRNFAKFTGKHLCQSHFLNKVAGLRPRTLLKERLWHRCFPVNFTKFIGIFFHKITLGDCFCALTFLYMKQCIVFLVYGKYLNSKPTNQPTHLI